MYKKLRAVHLSMGLFSLVFLVVYALSSIELAHRKWFAHPTRTTVERRRFAPGIADARLLARQWRGELDDVQTPPGKLKFLVRTPLGKTFDVTYSTATGEATVMTTTVSFMTILAFMHIAKGIWVWAAGFVSLSLMTLGATGIYLWFKKQDERWIGGVLLVFGTVLTIGLIISMRAG